MRASGRLLTGSTAFAFAMLLAGPVLAHTGGSVGGGFLTGFAHPISGWDHVVAMVAVGLWGAFLGMPAIWLLPIVFPMVMAFGGALGVVGIPVPSVETGIAVSAIVLGLCVALAIRPPLWIAAVIVGLFAIFHGHAHGTELPAAANPFAWPLGKVAVQTGGALIALVGVAFLTGMA
jgi:urease accessory protein